MILSCSNPSTEALEQEKNDLVSIGEKIKIDSKILGEEREVWVYKPGGFYGMDEVDVTYPVAYVMDGESQFIPTVGILDQMSSPGSANDKVPQMMVVGIVNTNRNRDLTPTKAMLGKDSSSIHITGGADLMASFIAEELIPYIESNYPTTPHRVLVGHSLGGLFVLNTLMKFPDMFQNYLSIDPALSWDEERFANNVIEALKSSDFDRKKLYVATANNLMSWMELEDAKTDTTEIMKMMRSNLKFKDALQDANLDISYENRYYEDENHFQIPLKASYDGFSYFYDYYTFPNMIEYYYPRAEENDLIEELEAHYEHISQEMGYQIKPMESYINSWAFGFPQFDRVDIAHTLFDLNIKNYKESANVYSAKGYFLLGQKDTVQAVEYFNKSMELKEVSHVKSTLESLAGWIEKSSL